MDSGTRIAGGGGSGVLPEIDLVEDHRTVIVGGDFPLQLEIVELDRPALSVTDEGQNVDHIEIGHITVFSVSDIHQEIDVLRSGRPLPLGGVIRVFFGSFDDIYRRGDVDGEADIGFALGDRRSVGGRLDFDHVEVVPRVRSRTDENRIVQIGNRRVIDRGISQIPDEHLVFPVDTGGHVDIQHVITGADLRLSIFRRHNRSLLIGEILGQNVGYPNLARITRTSNVVSIGHLETVGHFVTRRCGGAAFGFFDPGFGTGIDHPIPIGSFVIFRCGVGDVVGEQPTITDDRTGTTVFLITPFMCRVVDQQITVFHRVSGRQIRIPHLEIQKEVDLRPGRLLVSRLEAETDLGHAPAAVGVLDGVEIGRPSARGVTLPLDRLFVGDVGIAPFGGEEAVVHIVGGVFDDVGESLLPVAVSVVPVVAPDDPAVGQIVTPGIGMLNLCIDGIVSDGPELDYGWHRKHRRSCPR